ncbi:zwei Ig domain protein zig-8-like isoform X2 [Anthonomus grandis grandis]|uniref:zwei Ig domain protein zig-8-like isoform X2 n=1 Tax=Anthonomus grandis grandis TaxID=2921223 RepID=UPI0021665606|nr:zwei Ig domain protein zig-8-like isoform X2 [Anthonomus grandis grandis]
MSTMALKKWVLIYIVFTSLVGERSAVPQDSGGDLDLTDMGDILNELGASFPPLESPPVHFATENNTVVTAQTGSTALVPCVINNIGDGTVSWIRRKDYHLLTVGLATYSSDDRFQAIHLQHSEFFLAFQDWTLQIKFVQQRDAGLYECQVSSHPPTSIFIQLNVVEARADIQGPSEKYLKPGSGLRLQCTVLQSTEPPSYVFWYHNNRMINYDVDRGINVTTELSEKSSTLTITNAATRHSGNYSCVPSNAQPASTYVHILNGENPAAMQHGGRGLSWLQCSPSSWLLILFSLLLLMC